MDPISADYTIFFRNIPFGRVKAIIYDENLFQIDMLIGDNFMEAYNEVRKEYPSAKWNPHANETLEQL